MNLEKRMMKPGASRALKDILSALVAVYNKMATVKKHRIDSGRKSLIYNMLLGFLSNSVQVSLGSHRNVDLYPIVSPSSRSPSPRLRVPEELHTLLHQHYDQYRHESSG